MTFLVYLGVTLCAGGAAFWANRLGYFDLAVNLLANWTLANLVYAFAVTSWAWMSAAHLLLLVYAVAVYRRVGLGAAWVIASAYAVMLLNDALGPQGSYEYHVRQNALFLVQCLALIVSGGIAGYTARQHNTTTHAKESLWLAKNWVTG